MNEFERIDHFFKPLAGEAGLQLQDDAALIDNLVITTDTIVEGVHFEKNESPKELAYKLMGVNMSDLLSKGANPFGYFLNITGHFSDDWMQEFTHTLHQLQIFYGCVLMGGDTVEAPYSVLSMTLIGKTQHMIKRAGAQVGDVLCLSGPIGDSWIGLHSKGISGRDYFIHKYKRPTPPFPIKHEKATAAIDISDGLIADLKKLLLSSQVGAIIYLEHVWLSDPAIELKKQKLISIEKLVTAGDDYQVLWTCHKRNAPNRGVFGYIVPIEDGLTIWNQKTLCSFQVEGYIHASCE